MAVQNFKVTWFFGFKKWGWTESLYWTSGTAGITACESDAKDLAILRRYFLSKFASLEAIRIDACDPFGRAFLVGQSEIKFEGSGAGTGSLSGTCMNPWMALATRMYTEDRLYNANLFFRGIPDDLLCINTGYKIPYIISSKLVKLVGNWYTVVCRNSNAIAIKTGLIGSKLGITPSIGRWSILANTKDVGAPPNTGRANSVSVTDVTVDANGYFNVKTVGNVAFQLSTPVHLHGFKGDGLQNLNGDTIVTSKSTTPNTLKKKQLPAGCTINYDGRGLLWIRQKQLVPPTNATISRPIRRSSGLAYFGTKGQDSSKRAQKGK